MGAAYRKHTVLFLGRAGLCAGFVGLDRDRLRAVILLGAATPLPTRRLALSAGIAVNLAILVVYKYADFLTDKSESCACPVRGEPFPLLHLALPIGVSFRRVREDHLSGRHLSRHFAACGDASRITASSCCSFRNCWPDRSSNIIEMKDQIAAPPADRMEAISSSGFLRFARGIGRKLLIADPLGAFVNQIFAADPARPRRRPCLAGPRQLHPADLFRFCRLFRHGDRACAHAGISPAGRISTRPISPSRSRNSGGAGTSR